MTKIKKEEDYRTTLIKTKCLNCSLHFIICTERIKEWKDRKIHCPECGSTAQKLTWIDSTDIPVYEIVPGRAILQGLK